MTKPKIIPYNPKLKALAKKLRQNMTKAEVMLWQELRKKQMLGYDFDRQRPIDQYIVDFYCKELRLAIEVDGLTHTWEGVCQKDENREKMLNELGVRVLRFEDADVRKNLKYVLNEIHAWITENEQD